MTSERILEPDDAEREASFARVRAAFIRTIARVLAAEIRVEQAAETTTTAETEGPRV